MQQDAKIRVLPVRWFLDCISTLRLLRFPSVTEAFSAMQGTE